MPLINRYSITENGSMIFTGNTLGLTSNNGDVGAFITLDQNSQVAGFPPGTTTIWQNTESEAQLSVPAGSTVLYAELQWGGTYRNGSGSINIINDLDTPITFTTPAGTTIISSDSATAQEGPLFYSRSQDVTSLIQTGGSGTYSVAGVPAAFNTGIDTIGWTLGIIYENPSLPYQNMNIYSGIEEIGSAAPPVDFNLSGFITPFIGPVEGRVLVSAMEGDLGFSGDQMLLGPDTGTLVALSGPNNNVNNFFASQINDGDSESATVGQLDTSGTFGTINVPTDLPARYGWDITNVLSTNFVNNQTDAVVRITSTSDGYAIPLVGIQLDAIPIDFGDAPNTNSATQGPGNYRSLQASNGPIHIIDTNLRLGNQVTADSDAQQNILANGDDQIRGIPDDGTTLPLTPMAYDAASYSIDVTVNNNTGSNANVYAWLDFNQDGIFQTDEGTTAVVPSSVSTQNITLTFNRPVGAPTPIGNTYIRVRLTTDTLTNTGGATDEDTRSFGLANDGEVEDYFLPLTSEPFNCEAYGYRVAVPAGGTNSSLTQINLVTGVQVILNNDIGVNVNAIGYNTLDNLIYGMQNGTNNLIVIDSAGNVGNLGPVPNLPAGYNIGAIDNSGHLFIKSGGNSTYYVVDVDTNSPTFGQLLDPTAGFILDTAPYGTTSSPNFNPADWTFNANDGLLYGGVNGNVLRMDPITGVVTTLNTTGLPNGSYGSSYSVNDQYVYLTNNTTGGIYRVEINGNNADATLYSQDIPSGQNDGASCLNAELLIDFGDAPNNYKTLLQDNGPRHGIVNALTLGSQVTDEDDAYASIGALGDDQVNGIQDDGTSLPLTNLGDNALDYTITETVLNDTGVDANVYAWIDFNMDGIFQTNEGTTVVVPSSPTPQNIDLTFTVPVGTTLMPGDTYVRVRVTTDDLINTGGATDEDTRSFGPASDGEVEDYLLTVEDVQIISTKSVDPAFADLGDTLTYTVTLTNPGTIPVDDVLFTDPLPAGVTYANNLSVDAPYTGTDPMIGLTITTINPGQTVTISWDVLIGDTLPNPNPIINVGTVTIPTLPPDPTPEVSTQVNNATLTIVKNSNKDIVKCNESITYTIEVTNSGNIDANPVVVTDILPPGTTYIIGSLLIDGVANPSDPNTGIDIGPVAPGQTKIILFSVTVDEDASLPIKNTANVDYEYIVDPNEPPVEVTKTSNEVQVDVAKIEIVKSVDKEFIQIGDIITYTNTITSIGNAPIENIVFTDIPPMQTTYIDSSVTINGTLYPAVNPNGAIDLATVAPSLFPLDQGEFIIIEYMATVESIPTNPVISNTSSAALEYTDGGKIETCEEESNEVITTVREGEIELVKSVDKEIVEVGDTLTYTITATNTGNIDVDNVIITDIVPVETTFVEGSVLVDGVARPNDNPSTGINVGTIEPNQTVVVTFDVIVDRQPNSGQIKNTASATYEVLVDPNKPPVTETTDSNEVVTRVENPELTIIKNCTPKELQVGSIINYAFIIINTGSVNALNIQFFDIIPDGVEFVENSFVGSTKISVNPNDLISGVDIGDLAVGQQKSVSFKVKIIKSDCSPTVCNTASLNFEYELTEGQTLTKSIDSNECCVDIISSSFKQTFVDGKITISEENPSIESISNLDIVVQNTSTEIINSPIGISKEGQNLTGQKSLICINLLLTLTYVSLTPEQVVNSEQYEIYTCEYLVIPVNSQCECQSLNITIEDIYYEMIDERNVFYNITYLIDSCC